MTLACWPEATPNPLPTPQSHTLISNLLFITRRQRHRLGKADNLLASSSIHPTLQSLLSRGHCVGKTNGMIAFCWTRVGETSYSVHNLNVDLPFRAQDFCLPVTLCKYRCMGGIKLKFISSGLASISKSISSRWKIEKAKAERVSVVWC